MIWVIACLLLIVALMLLLTVFHNRDSAAADETGHRVAVALYAIRRRLEVADFKRELRSNGAEIRRQLRKELDQHDRGRR